MYLAPKEQLEKWKVLNEWLKKAFPKEVIPEEAMKDGEKKLDSLTSKDRLFYGFGDDGKDNADPFLSGHLFVNYLTQTYPNEKWSYVDFYPSPPDPLRFDFYRPAIKMSDKAAARPKGFYVKTLLEKDHECGIGTTHKDLSPADVRKLSSWGWGPEGYQFLSIDAPYTKLLLAGKVPTFVLGDYSVSPYGTSDYSSTFLLGVARGKLELGVTNVRDNIPKYAPSHFA